MGHPYPGEHQQAERRRYDVEQEATGKLLAKLEQLGPGYARDLAQLMVDVMDARIARAISGDLKVHEDGYLY